jgi:DNA-binding response OmpR family regulator
MDDRRTILVVEDDDALCENAAQLLTSRFPELRVVAVRDAATALRAIARRVPAVVLADRCLGQDDGAELITSFKRAHPNRFAILMTGGPSPDGEDQGAWAQADHVLFKPFEVSELVQVIGDFLERLFGAGCASGAPRRASSPAMPARNLPEPVIDAPARHRIVSKLNAMLLCARAAQKQLEDREGDVARAKENLDKVVSLIHEVSAQLRGQGPTCDG